MLQREHNRKFEKALDETLARAAITYRPFRIDSSDVVGAVSRAFYGDGSAWVRKVGDGSLRDNELDGVPICFGDWYLRFRNMEYRLADSTATVDEAIIAAKALMEESGVCFYQEKDG